MFDKGIHDGIVHKISWGKNRTKVSRGAVNYNFSSAASFSRNASLVSIRDGREWRMGISFAEVVVIKKEKIIKSSSVSAV